MIVEQLSMAKLPKPLFIEDLALPLVNGRFKTHISSNERCSSIFIGVKYNHSEISILQ
jgi:hypothetical protein